MKAQPLKIINGNYVGCSINEVTHLKLNLPGPSKTIILPVITSGERRGTPCWSWNGDIEFPTLKPSVLSTIGDDWTCHSWINDGKIQFLDDCTHEFKNQTLDLLEVDNED